VELTELIKDYVATELLSSIEIDFLEGELWETTQHIAEINTVINARKEIPSQKFISIGIAPPHLHLNSRLKERNSYEINLRNAGADLILNSIYDLKDINLNLF